MTTFKCNRCENTLELLDRKCICGGVYVLPKSAVEQRADNSDYAKCADDILKLELADEIINKHGCLVAILKRHFA